MKEYLRTFAKTGIALFCIWHMAAIGAYSIPSDARDRFSTWMRGHVIPVVTPYVLQTSQWQQWNLFAPNPLRRIVFYRVDRQTDGGGWTEAAAINRTTYGTWRHAVRFKLLGQALEENTNCPELAERAAQVLCRELGFAPGERMRIWHDVTIVPYVHPSPSRAWWNSWTPQFNATLAIETTCLP